MAPFQNSYKLIYHGKAGEVKIWRGKTEGLFGFIKAEFQYTAPFIGFERSNVSQATFREMIQSNSIKIRWVEIERERQRKSNGSGGIKWDEGGGEEKNEVEEDKKKQDE